MLQSVSGNYINSVSFNKKPKKNVSSGVSKMPAAAKNSVKSSQVYGLNQINTTLSASDKEKYFFLVDFLKDVKPSNNSEGKKPSVQLDVLLKNGKLLSKSRDDKSTTLDNLFDIAKIERAEGLDSKKILSDTLDILINPQYVTQDFGDIPGEQETIMALAAKYV